MTDENKAFQDLHAWMDATERLRAEHYLVFAGSFVGKNLRLFFVPFTALEDGSSKLRFGVFIKPVVEVVAVEHFWTKYAKGAKEAAVALQNMTDKAKTLVRPDHSKGLGAEGLWALIMCWNFRETCDTAHQDLGSRNLSLACR